MHLDGNVLAALLAFAGVALTGLVGAITLLVRMWGRLGRMEEALATTGKRLDALHTHAVTIREGQRTHERECAERWGRADAKAENVEHRLAELADRRWTAFTGNPPGAPA